MLLTILLAPFFFLPYTLSLFLDVTPSAPPPNSGIKIIWTVQNPSAPPDNFTLVLSGPNDQTTHDVIRGGRNSGSEQMGVGSAGPYSIEAMWPIGSRTSIGKQAFQVVQPQSKTLLPPSKVTSSSSVVGPISESTTISATEELVTRTSGETEHSDSSTPGTSNTTTSATTSSLNPSSGSPSGITSTTSPISAQSISNGGTGLQIAPSSSPSSSSSLFPSFPSSSSPASSTSSSSKRGMIVGSVLGSIIFFTLLTAILFCLWKRRKQRGERPVMFHRDMMVRTPGPTLYALSSGAFSGGHGVGQNVLGGEKDGYIMTTLEDTNSDSLSVASGEEEQPTVPSTPSTMDPFRNSNPFRDAELMSRYSVHLDGAAVVSPPLPGEPPGLY